MAVETGIDDVPHRHHMGHDRIDAARMTRVLEIQVQLRLLDLYQQMLSQNFHLMELNEVIQFSGRVLDNNDGINTDQDENKREDAQAYDYLFFHYSFR
jgi:hypothetical protein